MPMYQFICSWVKILWRAFEFLLSSLAFSDIESYDVFRLNLMIV